VIANGEVLAHNRSELISTRQATTAA
jgi:hypothetical protein